MQYRCFPSLVFYFKACIIDKKSQEKVLNWSKDLLIDRNAENVLLLEIWIKKLSDVHIKSCWKKNQLL